MFVAKVGVGDLIHRIARACFTKGAAEGSAFCGAEGKVTFSEAQIITCEKCRATIVKGMLKSPPVKGVSS